MNVLYQLSHCSSTRPDGWSGAPGEAVWVRDLVARVVQKAAPLGIAVFTVDGDLEDHPAFHADYDAFVAPHYEADVHNTGGCFWGRAAASLTGPSDDQLGQMLWGRLRAIAGAPPEHFEWSNPNVTDYYGFRLTSAKTPGALIEHGVGNRQPQDFTWLRTNIDAIADAHVAALAAFGGIAAPTTRAVLASSTISAKALRTFCPTAPDGVPELYATLAAGAGIDARVAFAQAVKETARFQFGGTAQPDWHNPAGLGVTGAAGVGNRFTTWEDGIRAHLAHLLCYFGPHTPSYCAKDQRHFAPHASVWSAPLTATTDDVGHAHLPNDVRQLDGRWAVPGAGYGASIAALAAQIKEEPVTPTTPATIQDVYAKVDALSGSVLVWLARLQRGLDVERGDAFDPARPPVDPRVITTHNLGPRTASVKLRTLTADQKAKDGHGKGGE